MSANAKKKWLLQEENHRHKDYKRIIKNADVYQTNNTKNTQ